MNKIKAKAIKLIERLENSEMSLKLFLLTFAGIVLIRTFLEAFANKGFIGPFSSWTLFPHVILWFASVFIWIAVIIKIFTKTDIIKILKTQIFFLVILWFPVLFDFFITGGKGITLTYILVPHLKDLLVAFFLLPFNYQSLGLAIEVFLVSIGGGLYTYNKTRKMKWGLLGALSVYIVIFIHLSFPSFPIILKNYRGGSEDAFSYYITTPFSEKVLLSKNYILKLKDFFEQITSFFDIFSSAITFYTLLAGLLITFYLWNKNKFKAFMKNLRWLRLLHYWLMFAAGIIVAYIIYSPIFTFNFWNLLLIGLMFISIVCSWARAVGENDIIDEEADKISNPERPLVKKQLAIADVRNLNLILFILTIFSALIVSYHALIFILLFNAIYFVYSSPPLKLKRFPIVSPLLIASASLSIIMAGFFIAMPFSQLTDFPKKIIALVIISIALAVNFKDIKDIKSDKKFGVKTLPVIFGEEKGKFIIGILFFLAFLLVPIILKQAFLLLPAAVFGILGFFSINRKPYNEKLVFLSYFLYFASIIIFYLVKFFG